MLHLREAAGSHEANRYRQALEYLFADPDGDVSPELNGSETGGTLTPNERATQKAWLMA